MDSGGALRRASTPVDHLVAEMAAMPIASPVSLELAITTLEPRLPDEIAAVSATRRSTADTTAALWRRTEYEMLKAFPAVSLDELVAIRDMVWFHRGAQSPRPIDEYLQDMACLFLEARGSSVAPTLPIGHLGRSEQRPTSAQSRRTLRWLMLALPPDLLCAAAARGDDALDLALTNTTVDQMLREGGFAETHLHLGAALEFGTIWQALVANVGTGDFSPEYMLSPGADFDEGRHLAHWLVRGCVARLILAWYLRDRTSAPGRGSGGGRRWIRDGEYRDFDDYFRDRGNWIRTAPGALGGSYAVAATALADLQRGSLDGSPATFGMLQHLYGLLAGPTTLHRAERIADVELFDPLSAIFAVPGRRPGGAQMRSFRTPEQRLVGRAMKYISHCRRTQTSDTPFERLFWQVVRVRCLAYRHFVQRPMTPGLQWFVRFYARSRPARSRLGWGAYLDAAAEIDGRGKGLRSLEVRRSPDDTLDENVDFVQRTAQWTQEKARVDTADGPLEVGIVLHFTKDRGGGAMKGLPSGHWKGSNADPDPDPARRVNASGMRYSAFYVRKRTAAVALARTLQRWPRSLRIIRGLDVCTDELGVPNWVIRPLLDRVRNAADLASIALDRLGEGPAPQLRTTAHAGEDFVHLTTGLRGVDEAIEHLGLSEGDRIGHGIALGVDATTWTQRTGRVAIPREVRIWDLLWEWTWNASRGGGSVPRHSFIERELSRLTGMVFGEVISPYELELLRDDLLDTDALWLVGWPHADQPLALLDQRPSERSGSAGRLRLLGRYLSDQAVFDEGRRVEWVDPSTEAEAIEHLQDGLRRKVASLGLTIEINPTSNLLIGDLGSLTQHPMWRLDPPTAHVNLPPVAVCVGADDPLMFGTNLIQEYNVLYDGLVEAGLTDADARRWLERVRRRGMESRFTEHPAQVRPVTELPNPLRDYPSQLV